jgi:hypothetical protein
MIVSATTTSKKLVRADEERNERDKLYLLCQQKRDS